MSARGNAWRKGGSNALYLGDGTAGQVLTTRPETDAPVVAIFKGDVLLATRPGYVNRRSEVVVTWDGAPLETVFIPPNQRHPRAPHARYRANVPAKEEP